MWVGTDKQRNMYIEHHANTGLDAFLLSENCDYFWCHGFNKVLETFLRDSPVLPRPKGALLDSDVVTVEVTEFH